MMTNLILPNKREITKHCLVEVKKTPLNQVRSRGLQNVVMRLLGVRVAARNVKTVQ